jgi:hypothetical protein
MTTAISGASTKMSYILSTIKKVLSEVVHYLHSNSVSINSEHEVIDSGKLLQVNPSLLNVLPVIHLEPQCHALEPRLTQEIDDYFIQHWPFPNPQAIRKFRAAKFSEVTCYYFPEALDDRIHFACRLITLLFLIDGLGFSPSFISGY